MPPTGTGYTGLPSRNAPTNSYNTSHMKLLLDTSNTEPQTQSSLFSRIPGEIRNHIFDLALTAYPGKQEPLYKNAYYCRPGFRYADMKIDTALLLTCRRAYREARLVPLHNYEHVSWSEFRCAPSVRDAKRCPIDSRSGDIYPWVPSLYLFAARGYLEDIGWRIYVRDPRVLALKDLRSLKITIRHCDWNSFETGYPLELDAKQEPMPLATRRSTATDEFQKKSWGRQFLVFKGLKKLELELETIEERREEIDGIITRAADWRFPLQHGNVFVMNPARTKKTGWHGVRHREYLPPATLPRIKAYQQTPDKANSNSTKLTYTQRPKRSQG